MEWRRWQERREPIWAEDQLATWIKLNPVARGHINIAVERAIREAKPELIDQLSRFEQTRDPSAARTGRLYFGSGADHAQDDLWIAAALAFCWRYTYAPRFVDATDAVDAYLDRRPIHIAGVTEDWRQMLIEAPLLLLRDVALRETPHQRDALQSLLSRRLNDGVTTIVSFRHSQVCMQMAAHWFHGGNDLVAVQFSKKPLAT